MTVGKREIEYETPELLITCMAREVENGDFLFAGIGSPLSSIAFSLARRTHAPDLYFLYAGNIVGTEPPPVGLVNPEHEAGSLGLKKSAVDEVLLETVPNVRVKQFFQAIQLDRFGNFNTVAIGPYQHPKVRLAGAAIMPEATAGLYYRHYLWLPRQSSRSLVEEVDFCSGVGWKYSGQKSNGGIPSVSAAGEARLFTDLAVFGLNNKGELSLLSLHPGISIERVLSESSFPIDVPQKVNMTPMPSPKDLDLIADIDPFGCRELDFLGGDRRKEKIRQIYEKELRKTVSS